MNAIPRTEMPGAILATVAADLAEVQALAAPFPVNVVTLENLQQDVIQRDPSGRPICVVRDTELLGAVTSTGEGAARVEAGQELIALMTGPGGFGHFRADQEGAARFGPWLCGRMAHIAAAYLKDAAQLRRSNAVLRREHDDVLERFALLERAYASSGPSRVSKLDYAADGEVGAPAGAMVQRLPISPLGVGLVDLKVISFDPAAAGVLNIALFAQGRPEALQQWSLRGPNLCPGWLNLRMERAVGVRAMETRLEVRWNGEASQAPVLGLAAPTPLREYAVTSDDRVDGDRALAVKVWGFVPGTRVPTAAQEDNSGAEDEPPLQFSLSANELARSELAHPLGLSLGFDLVAYRPGSGDLLVHPHLSGTTIGVIRDIPLANARALKAIVRVENKEAGVVEFGLALVRPQASYADPSHFIGSWTRVKHSDFVEAPGDVAAPYGPYDLVIATRMADNADPHLAWAMFKKIEITA